MSDLFPRPEPRDAFRRALRARLMAEAASTVGRRETTWTRFQRSWLRPALAAGVAAFVLVVGAGSAAADSLPGDLAFGLKRAAEDVPTGYAPKALDGWIARATTIAKTRDCFVYVINGAKVRAPAGEMALIERLAR